MPHSGTRGLGQHPLTSDLLVKLSEWLRSVDGGKKSPREAKEILSDISKFMYYIDPSKPDPDTLCETQNYVKYIEQYIGYRPRWYHNQIGTS